MLDAGEHRIVRGEIVTLQSAHARGSEQLAEQHLLTCALDHPPPALIAGNVDHREEGPVDARPGGLERRDAAGAGGQFGLEARRLGEGNREDRSIAVDHVRAEHQRYLQPRVRHHRVLHS